MDNSDVAGQGISPIEPANARTADTLRTAAIWLGLGAAMYLAWTLSGAILVLFAGLIFGIALDGGARLLRRVAPLPHWARLTIVCAGIVVFLGGAALLIGNSVAEQAETMAATLSGQLARLQAWLAGYGVSVDLANLQRTVVEGVGVGRLTGWLGNVAGGLAALLLIVVVGVYIAAEPKLYARGLAWLTPHRRRADYETLYEDMARTMRRWIGGRLAVMAADGILVGVGLSLFGVPLAVLLGLLSFLLAFVPNVGAFIAGALATLIGFSVDTTTGLAALGVFLAVQFIEGNLLNPYVERKVVDLAPAVVLAVQLLFGSLFGILGLALADPLVAMVKVALHHRAERLDEAAAT